MNTTGLIREKVTIGWLRRLSVMFILLFRSFSIFSQENFYARFQIDTEISGAYSFEMVRYWKPLASADTFTNYFHIVQEISDSTIRNDRAILTRSYNDTTVLSTLQNRQLIYTNLNDHYDTVLLDEANIHKFFSLVVVNLRYLHNQCDQKDFPFSDCRDTTAEKMEGSEEIDTTIVSIKLDSSGVLFSGQITVYDILMHDTQYVNVVFRGSKISTDSFETLFEKSSAFIGEINRNWIKPEPVVSITSDTANRAVQLDSSWYESLEVNTISEEKISLAPSGEYKVFYFYFNGCIPCMFAKPYIRQLQKDARFEVVVVNGVDKDSAEIMYRLSRDSIEGVPVIIADKDMLGRFHVSPFPSVILFDENGTEIDRCEGFDEEWYRRLMGK